MTELDRKKEFLESNQRFLRIIAEEKLDTPTIADTTKECIEATEEKIKGIKNLIAKLS